jgi:hypothetical protein
MSLDEQPRITRRRGGDPAIGARQSECFGRDRKMGDLQLTPAERKHVGKLLEGQRGELFSEAIDLHQNRQSPKRCHANIVAHRPPGRSLGSCICTVSASTLSYGDTLAREAREDGSTGTFTDWGGSNAPATARIAAPMLTGEIKGQIDRVWDAFIAGPLAAAVVAFGSFGNLREAVGPSVRSLIVVDAFFGALVFT